MPAPLPSADRPVCEVCGITPIRLTNATKVCRLTVACAKESSRRREQSRVKSPAETRRRNLSKLGVTPEWYTDQLRLQDGRCAICRTNFPGKKRKEGNSFCIDHDHEHCPPLHACQICIRGLLCDKCNRGMGLFGDSIEVLERAIGYLKNPPAQYGKSPWAADGCP